MIILGIDPGLTKTGWGIIESKGSTLRYIASGRIKTTASLPLYKRLVEIDTGLNNVIQQFNPDTAGIEVTFMNNNPASALKLGVARGVGIIAPARHGLHVGEYAPNLIKKSVVGAGKANKDQVMTMIKILLPSSGNITEDEADALAIAITHAHHQ